MGRRSLRSRIVGIVGLKVRGIIVIRLVSGLLEGRGNSWRVLMVESANYGTMTRRKKYITVMTVVFVELGLG